MIFLREVFRLHDVMQYLDLSGGNLKQQQDEPVAGCSYGSGDSPRKSKLRQRQESSSDEDDVNVFLDLSALSEAPENSASPAPQLQYERAEEMSPSGNSTSGTPESHEDVAVYSDSHRSPATEEAAGNAIEETDSFQTEATPDNEVR
jgi:hypothetical protein